MRRERAKYPGFASVYIADDDSQYSGTGRRQKNRVIYRCSVPGCHFVSAWREEAA